ncbi:MAG: amino acid adenylation domain-containing protein [Candidatus Obscuribacterales bacterium]|nr:amino acid adenylation domain-containing protein [Candidatus Obscuribacterales bacterium]
MGAESFLSSFNNIVRKHKNACAILCEGQRIVSYEQLYERAQQLAAKLKANGIAKEHVVGLGLEKSDDYIVAMLATWYSGAAFMPLDPQLPAQRLAFMIEQAGTKLVIAHPHYQPVFNQLGVETIIPSAANQTQESSDFAANAPNDLAYVIFTSGSTGRPKGVMIEHKGIVNFIEKQIEVFQLKEQSRALFYLSTNFDASISDIGTALLSAATICLENPALLQPGPGFVSLIAERKITHMDIPPSLLRFLDPNQMPASLETIIIGGETCAPDIVRSWAAKFRVVNVYGPTEATVCTSLNICDAKTWTRPLIGEPIPGIKYLIEDGELHIGGIGLARGYLNQPELDAAKFITLEEERFYKTGDLVVQHEHGEIEFLGRADRQFKLRGRLIAPEEIENQIMRQRGVEKVAVIKRPLKAGNSREMLVAFIQGTSLVLNSTEIRNELKKALPLWMIPQRFQIINKLPLTASGKIDSIALQQRPLPTEAPNEEPENNLPTKTRTLIKIWQQVLGITELDLETDFFDLGGDSFGLLEVAVAAHAQGINISPSLLQSQTTIAKIIKTLEQENNGHDGSMESEMLRQDLFRENKEYDWFSKNSPADNKLQPAPKNILLTGASGFLGARLLVELLKRCSAQIYCLVRARDQRSAMARLHLSLQKQGLELAAADLSRLHVVCGSLEKNRFGLLESEWQKLSQDIDTIYHCAAQVNMLLSYAELKPSNVLGSGEIVRLLKEGRQKHLHYASTLSVFVATDRNKGKVLETDKLEENCLVFGGYAQSKFAAELLFRLSETTQCPISYYRLGLITGDSQTGLSADSDFLSLFVRGIATLGYMPTFETELKVDVTPLDYAAAALAEISLQDIQKGNSATYHIANQQSLLLKDLIAYMQSFGIKINQLSPAQFKQRLEADAGKLDSAQSAACLALCRCLGDSFTQYRTMDLFQATDMTFSMQNTISRLAGSRLSCPPPSEALIHKYLARLGQHS